jgi:hypothetical protein
MTPHHPLIPRSARPRPHQRESQRNEHPARAAPCRTALLQIAACAALLGTAPAMAQDRADIDRTQIIGNRELPKVLYIVPWKKPAAGDLSAGPTSGVLEEAFAPIDRDVFRRQVRYDALLQAQVKVAAPPPAPQ